MKEHRMADLVRLKLGMSDEEAKFKREYKLELGLYDHVMFESAAVACGNKSVEDWIFQTCMLRASVVMGDFHQEDKDSSGAGRVD